MSSAPKYIPHYTLGDYRAWEGDWEVADDTVVRPDVAVLCGEVPERFIQESPRLIAEITSERTRHKDATAKRDLYAQQGVGTYLRIDPARQQIELDRLIGTGQYASAETTDPLPLPVHDDCQISLDLKNIFHPR